MSKFLQPEEYYKLLEELSRSKEYELNKNKKVRSSEELRKEYELNKNKKVRSSEELSRSKEYELNENKKVRSSEELSKEYEQLLKKLANKTTSRDYFTNDGVLYPKRKELHDKILKEILSKYESSNNPRIHFLLGSIGSGKTSVKDQILIEEQNKKDFIFVNFDDLKKELPEYELLKKLCPEKAAQFVQSESAKLAGTLFKKAIKKKCNILFEKNIRKGVDNKKIQLIEDISKTIRKDYLIFIHIVFLDSYEEAWKRVEKRANEIKRFVPKKEVKETFNNLFSNFNIVYQHISKESFGVCLWYNGVGVKEVSWIAAIVNSRKETKEKLSFETTKLFVEKGHYTVILLDKVRLNALPKKVVKSLETVDCLELKDKNISSRRKNLFSFEVSF